MRIKRKRDQDITSYDLETLKLGEAMTGGGCTALIYNIKGKEDHEFYPEQYLMITEIEGCQSPVTWLAPVQVCFYWNEGEQWDCWEVVTFEEFVEAWYDNDYE